MPRPKTPSPAPALPAGAPKGLRLVSVLSSTERAQVLRVSGEAPPCDAVLRIGRAGGAEVEAELSLFARLSAPGLVAPAAFGRTDDGRTWLLRPFVEGQPFDAAVSTATPAAVAAWTRALLGTLAALHDAGWVHRDIKSANVIVGGDGVFLVDLDLAGASTAPIGAHASAVHATPEAAPDATPEAAPDAMTAAGSAFHVAPEVLLGQRHSPRADLFSLGAMLALAFCGAPTSAFHAHFPGRSFWQASGLDPARLPQELAPLVQALLRRHPEDRPASARAALALLEGADATTVGAEAAGHRELPFLAGREAALQRVVALVPGTSVLLTVRDAEELPELADQVQLVLALAGRRTRRPAAEQDEHPGLWHAAVTGKVTGADVALTVFVGEPDLERVLALLLAATEAGTGLVVLASPESAAVLTAAMQQRGLQAELGHLTLLPWPRVSRAALELHLRRLTGDASPELAAALAASAHERTAGRRADLNRMLACATDAGVLRADGALYTPLRADWPEAVAPEAALAAEVAALPAVERAVLAALSVLGAPAARPLLRAVLLLDDRLLPTEIEAALHALLARGLLRAEADGRLDVRDPRWLQAARRGLDTEAARAWHQRCLQALADSGSPGTRGTALPGAAWARHAAALAQSESEWRAVLDVADAELAAGRVPQARALLQAAREAPGLARRLALLEARLELAQGRARDALALLQRAHGEDLSDATPEELLVAAQAAEQCGERVAAGRWLTRVLAASADRGQVLDARRGLGYAAWLDGRWQDTLDLLGDEPRADDPDEAAAALLNLRGVACVRLQRFDDAAGCFDAALARCRHGGHALWLARTELNRALLDRRRGRCADAIAALRRAESAFDAAGHVSGRALALHNLGVLHRDVGDLAAARGLLHEALALRRRTGDAHGVAASLGSLALLRCDAGQVGAALAELEAARGRLERGAYAAEAQVLELHRAMALALAGRHVDAASALAAAEARPADAVSPGVRAPTGEPADEQAALRARATALVRACAGEESLGRTAAQEACRLARASGDAAEMFRAAALLLALAPHDAAALAALSEAVAALGSPVREAELRWRRSTTAPAALAQLAELLDAFERAGRTDLVRSVALALAHAADAAGDVPARRRATARAAEATDALADALPAAAREPALQRLARWHAGCQPESAAVGPGDDERAAHGAPPRGLDVAWLLTCNRRMAAEDDLQGLLLGIVDSALELTGARRGLLVLLEGEDVSVQVARGMDRAAMPEDEVRFSLTVVRDAVTSGRTVVTTDAGADSRFRGTQSIASFGLRSVLCVPLRLPAPVTGALYLDNDQRASAFDDTDAERTGWLADQASLAITNLRRRAELQAGAAELAARHAELLAQRAEIDALNRRLAARVQTQEAELATARTLLRQQGGVAPAPGMVGDSEAMQRVYTLIDRLGPTELPVLVTGPSGAGKDLVARALHARSSRADKPLVIENVAALPPTLLESELFGHVRGAFTGADRDRPGLFAEADGGTFFLDEIGDMPLELQAKLLRVLETGEYRPVGARRNVRVDVRIVAATHRDLPARVREGSFREDLYYRLNGAEIRLPPLAGRLDDIPLLVAHFLQRLNTKHGTERAIREPVVRALARRPWPGQVRELVNEVSRLYFLSGDVIDDPTLVREPASSGASEAPDGQVRAGGGSQASLKLEDAERVAVQRALTAAAGRKDKAAKLLGISRAGLYAKLTRLGLAADGED